MRFIPISAAVLLSVALSPMLLAADLPGGGTTSGCRNGGTGDPPCETQDGGCACAKPGSSSIMNPYSGLYIHDAFLYRAGDRLGDSGGCSPCGASASMGDLPRGLPSLEIKRFYRSRNGSYLGSLGDNFFLSTDTQLRIEWSKADGSGVTVRLFEPEKPTFKRYFTEQRNNNGILSDPSNQSKDARMYTAAGELTAIGPTVDTIVITDQDQTQWTYKVIDVGFGAQARGARLSKITERTGVIRQSISYVFAPDATAATLGNDPARLWEVAKVIAADGTSATYEYDNVVKHGGRYAVSRIAFPNATAATFTYTGENLSAIGLPDGTQATFAVSYDATLQKVRTVIRDPGAEPGHQLKTVWWSGSSFTQPDGHKIAQSEGQVRRIDNGAGEISLAIWNGSNVNLNDAPIYLWGADTGLIPMPLG